MVPSMRKWFNENFTQEKYHAYLRELESLHPGALDFRVAETPVFIDKIFTRQMLDACENIIDFIIDKNFKQLTAPSIPLQLAVPNENSYPHFIAFDFGICQNKKR